MFAAQPPDRRIVVAVDMERYSGRPNRLQHLAQETFHRIMREAAQALGLDRENWTRQYGGDSELAILPAGTPEPTIVARLVPELNNRLREHNRDLQPDARVRLRVAIHAGLVHLDGATGFPGEAIVTVCRLVDAPALKATMGRFPDAAVGLIVSDHVYRDVVVRGYDGIRTDLE